MINEEIKVSMDKLKNAISYHGLFYLEIEALYNHNDCNWSLRVHVNKICDITYLYHSRFSDVGSLVSFVIELCDGNSPSIKFIK